MDAENGKMKTEYSPLNNMTSSGEEVEQFALPVTTSLTDRPKRRRKRKDFDTLKTHALPAMHRGQSMCSCAGCFTAIIICVLIASVCGLGAIIYSLSNNISEMQKLIDNLQIARGSASSELLSVKSKTDEVDNQLKTLSLQTQNLSSLIWSNSENNTKLSEKVKSIVTAHNNEKSSSDASQEVQQQLAQFGSDIGSLKGDVASLKQQSQSLDDRISSLDTSVQRLEHLSPVYYEVTTSDHTDDREQKARFEEMLYSVNNTCNSKIGAINQLLQKTDSNFHDYKVAANHSMHAVKQDMEILREDFDSGFSEFNSTLHYLQLVQAGKEDNSSLVTAAELTNRVDQLEAYVREVSLKLDSKLTTQLENDVVNVTMLSGMEDIITRVINEKLSIREGPAHAVAVQAAGLEARIIRLEDNFRSLTNILHDHKHTTPKPTESDTEAPALSDEGGNSNGSEATTVTNTDIQTTLSDRADQVTVLPLTAPVTVSEAEITVETPKNESEVVKNDILADLLGHPDKNGTDTAPTT